MEQKEIRCLMCGQCCYLLDKDDKITRHKCKHLIRLKNGKTLCRIYSSRLGKKLSKYSVCGLRKDSPYDFPGCPYNTNKPMAWGNKK